MKKRPGFTLIELMVVVVGISILSALAYSSFTPYNNTAKKADATAKVALIGSAVTRYKMEIGSYPANLTALTSANGDFGPWLDTTTITSDPWGTTNTGINGSGGTSGYAYARTSTGFAVWSFGANKANNSGGSGSSLPTFAGDDVGFRGQ